MLGKVPLKFEAIGSQLRDLVSTVKVYSQRSRDLILSTVDELGTLKVTVNIIVFFLLLFMSNIFLKQTCHSCGHANFSQVIVGVVLALQSRGMARGGGGGGGNALKN